MITARVAYLIDANLKVVWIQWTSQRFPILFSTSFPNSEEWFFLQVFSRRCTVKHWALGKSLPAGFNFSSFQWPDNQVGSSLFPTSGIPSFFFILSFVYGQVFLSKGGGGGWMRILGFSIFKTDPHRWSPFPFVEGIQRRFSFLALGVDYLCWSVPLFEST